MNNQKISTICILVAGAMWGTMGLFVRGLGLDGLTSMEIVFVRSAVAAVLLLLYLIVCNRKLLIIKVKDLWCFVGTGIVSLTLFNICYFTTIQRTSMAVAAILLYTSPVFVTILSAVLFSEKITVIKSVALVVAFAGCVLVTGILSGAGAVMDVTGILVGIGAGVGYALYSIFGRYAIERGYASETISLYTFMFTTLGMLAASPFVAPIPEMVAKIAQGNAARDIILLVGLAVVATIMPYLLYTKGLMGVENSKAGIMASVEPVVATILGIVVYKESLSLSTVVGIVCVLGAIVLLNISTGDSKQD